jgi:hypothetical protein
MERRPNCKALCAATLIAARRAQIEQSEPSPTNGRRRPPSSEPILVRDNALADKPLRTLQFRPTSVSFNLIVRTLGGASAVVDRINLLAADAPYQLARYEVVDE